MGSGKDSVQSTQWLTPHSLVIVRSPAFVASGLASLATNSPLAKRVCPNLRMGTAGLASSLPRLVGIPDRQ